MTTATATKPATKTVVLTKSALDSDSETEVYDFPAKFAATFDALSNARYTRQEAEKKEKALKKELTALLPPRKKGVKFVLRCKGVIRAAVRLDVKGKADLAMLLSAFPEAYATCYDPEGTQYDVVNPA
jgi:hypothetical protein